ncbi:MAG: citryl-CoA lyase [Gemmatimonas sp.]
MDPWKTALSDADATNIRIRGYDLTSLMLKSSFADVLFLLHMGRLPTEGEGKIVNAILIAAVDHGPGSPSAAAARLVASGNRQAPEAALAAGVLAMGDVHAGAGLTCLELINSGVVRAEQRSLSIEQVAREIVTSAIETQTRLPGLGHRVHTTIDPRTNVLFALAAQYDIASTGVQFMRALEQSAEELIKPLPINIDGALAAVLYDIGCSPLFAKFIFILGRAGGLSAQVMEEYTRERPMRIRIPVEYDGEAPRDVP